ncbi:MAG: glycoside hydrolase family 2 TIM barrel-domain containing protein, partial [Victivallales bacterium]|nr:glycoside hydrolase family 2 TIM barrel-domain containing protein [Victivallales bacterium]
EDPFLYDVTYEVLDSAGKVIDRVGSYAGLRKIAIIGRKIYLNNREIFLRLVLDQGFYPDGIWTAPSDAALKRDIELGMAAGFNGARLHQKVFEERYHYWADKLGYLTFGESASWGTGFFGRSKPDSAAYWQSALLFFDEWRQIVERDFNHPSIIVWTLANETGGAKSPYYAFLIQELYRLVKTLDSTRPISDCSGWIHVKTDFWTIHTYAPTGQKLQERLTADHAAEKNGAVYAKMPYLVDEWGGFRFIPPARWSSTGDSWGYNNLNIKTEDDLCRLIAEQIKVMMADPDLAGYCYTQLTDVEQEQNGVYNYDRTPKVSAGKLKMLFGQEPSRFNRK